MLWNKRTTVQLFGLLFLCCVNPVFAAGVCPSSNGQPLRFVDVFDGAPDELSTLVPDEAGKQSGYWHLGYVYEAGRFVTIGCKYADGQTKDVKLPNKVTICDYKIDAKEKLTLSCR